MIIKRKDINGLNNLIMKLKDQKFDINLQYKIIKIKRSIKEEIEIYKEQIYQNCQDFFELDENGMPIVNETGGYKVKSEKIQECNQMVERLSNVDIQVPDIYFSLEELSTLGLTMEELEIFMPFIK